MRGMRSWAIEIVTCRGTEAANEPWTPFERRIEVMVSSAGAYRRVLLTKRNEQTLPWPRPEWA